MHCPLVANRTMRWSIKTWSKFIQSLFPKGDLYCMYCNMYTNHVFGLYYCIFGFRLKRGGLLGFHFVFYFGGKIDILNCGEQQSKTILNYKNRKSLIRQCWCNWKNETQVQTDFWMWIVVSWLNTFNIIDNLSLLGW